mmetsp:Transcript_167198/g.537058  ORF Transcript_167198/g.537058 Transcript_167198/m.537058 type:complete len:223 (+) Transcript_167198:764-1432(+)
MRIELVGRWLLPHRMAGTVQEHLDIRGVRLDLLKPILTKDVKASGVVQIPKLALAPGYQRGLHGGIACNGHPLTAAGHDVAAPVRCVQQLGGNSRPRCRRRGWKRCLRCRHWSVVLAQSDCGRRQVIGFRQRPEILRHEIGPAMRALSFRGLAPPKASHLDMCRGPPSSNKRHLILLDDATAGKRRAPPRQWGARRGRGRGRGAAEDDLTDAVVIGPRVGHP